jgi:hypothetical protein
VRFVCEDCWVFMKRRIDVRSEDVRVLGLHEKAVSAVMHASEQSTSLA